MQRLASARSKLHNSDSSITTQSRVPQHKLPKISERSDSAMSRRQIPAASSPTRKFDLVQAASLSPCLSAIKHHSKGACRQQTKKTPKSFSLSQCQDDDSSM